MLSTSTAVRAEASGWNYSGVSGASAGSRLFNLYPGPDHPPGPHASSTPLDRWGHKRVRDSSTFIRDLTTRLAPTLPPRLLTGGAINGFATLQPLSGT